MVSNLEIKPSITAVIPIAGFPNGIEQILQWVNDPALQDFEIILVVDSNSIQIRNQVRKLADDLHHAKNVSILESSHRNPGGTRNIGLEHARGEWITFWDCDDIPNPTSFLTMVLEANQNNADIAVGAFTIKTKSKTRLIQIRDDSIKQAIQSVALNPGLWRFCIRANLAKGFRFPLLSMAEDQIFLAEVLLHHKKLLVFKRAVYEYWVYSNGQLTKNNKALQDLPLAFHFFQERIRIHECDELVIVATRLWVTALKKCNLKAKVSLTAQFIKLAFSSINFPLKMIRSIWLIWKVR